MRLRTGTVAVAVVVLSAVMLFSSAVAAADGFERDTSLVWSKGRRMRR